MKKKGARKSLKVETNLQSLRFRVRILPQSMAGRGGRWGRNENWWILIWIMGIGFIFHVLQLAMRYSPLSSSSDLRSLYNQQRSRLYDNLVKDFESKGLTIPSHSDQYQPSSLPDGFTIRNGLVTPVLKPVTPPARANALYLSPAFSTPIAIAVNDTLGPYFDQGIWFQDPNLYHFSMFHASHHLFPVSATQDEVEAEARAIQNVVESLCPLEVFLERVILTSSGVILGCWQVTSGSDPFTIRSMLRRALPRAPGKQSNDPVILHTSFARLLNHPKSSSMDPSRELQFLKELVGHLNDRISGLNALISELWYVEEYDVLALAYRGRMKTRKFHLLCRETNASFS